MLQEEFEDEFLQRIGIFLLNSLACQVEGHQKQTLGDLGTIRVGIIVHFKLQCPIMQTD